MIADKIKKLIFVFALLLWTTAVGALDDYIQGNPAIASAYELNPTKTVGVIDTLERLLLGEELKEEDKRGDPDGIVDEDERRRLLDENPFLEEAWRINPKIALAQLETLVAINTKGNR